MNYVNSQHYKKDDGINYACNEFAPNEISFTHKTEILAPNFHAWQ